MVTYPGSLEHSEEIKRCFRSSSGELGFLPQDAEIFVRACEQCGLAILGWEVWIVDHQPSFGAGHVHPPVPTAGAWCGLVPTKDGATGVFGGSVNRNDDEPWAEFVTRSANATREGIARFESHQLVDVEPAFRASVRYNFCSVAEND